MAVSAAAPAPAPAPVPVPAWVGWGKRFPFPVSLRCIILPMPRIRVLADSLVNRIAAGEVVERPASVLKELVENSLDAGSSRLEVDLSVGGRTLVRVVDDGCGMDPDDVLLALERHATSKLSGPDDLDHITTLGFRGEALPSIAAVSRFTLGSCADPAEGGAEVTVEGGRVLGTRPLARARGTTVEVRDLFFNLPARRKFLHAAETELRHAQEALAAAALARPDVAVVLRHGGRTLLDLAPVDDPAHRLAELERRRLSGPVRRFAAAAEGVEVEGLLAETRSSGRPALTFLVNGRPVRDRLLVGAVMRVLRGVGHGLGGARLVVSLRLPPDLVDVNVHPTKAEVRFARAGSVFAAVERAVRNGVAGSHGRVDVRRVEGPPAFSAGEGSGMAAPPGFSPASAGTAAASLFPHPVYDGQIAAEPLAWPSSETRQPAPSGARAGAADTPFGRLIGQYRASFLLLEDAEGLVIVDQHVAHERVLYDEIRRRLAGAPAASQRLLAPLLLELDEALVGALDRIAGLLERVGIEADAFGPDTVRLVALPPDLPAAGAGELLTRLLERATDLDGVPERVEEELSDALAADLSCKAAVKVNHPLTAEKQRALLADLAGTSDPYRCPHGRPIVLRLSELEMERRFGRR